jgi:hypothetical protein
MSTKLLSAFLGLALFTVSAQDRIDARDMFFSIGDLAHQQPPQKVSTATLPRPRRNTHSVQHPPAEHPAAGQAAAEHPVRVVANPLGLRYSLLRRGAARTFDEISPDATFRAGDLVRISVTSNQRGYLYIIQKGSSGEWTPLFPDPQISGGDNLVAPETRYEVPGKPGEAFRIEGQPGEEKVFILLTRSPEADMDKLIASLRQGESQDEPGARDRVLDHIRSQTSARDLVFAKFDDSADEKAVYVVNQTAGGTEARVMVDVTLNHR